MQVFRLEFIMFGRCKFMNDEKCPYATGKLCGLAKGNVEENKIANLKKCPKAIKRRRQK